MNDSIRWTKFSIAHNNWLQLNLKGAHNDVSFVWFLFSFYSSHFTNYLKWSWTIFMMAESIRIPTGDKWHGQTWGFWRGSGYMAPKIWQLQHSVSDPWHTANCFPGVTHAPFTHILLDRGSHVATSTGEGWYVSGPRNKTNGVSANTTIGAPISAKRKCLTGVPSHMGTRSNCWAKPMKTISLKKCCLAQLTWTTQEQVWAEVTWEASHG